MTAGEVINSTIENKPSSTTSDQMLKWLNELEHLIADKIYKDPLTTDITEDTELSAQVPFEEIYELFLRLKIDFALENYDSYNNGLAMYNALYKEFATAYVRNNPTTAETQKTITNYW